MDCCMRWVFSLFLNRCRGGKVGFLGFWFYLVFFFFFFKKKKNLGFLFFFNFFNKCYTKYKPITVHSSFNDLWWLWYNNCVFINALQCTIYAFSFFLFSGYKLKNKKNKKKTIKPKKKNNFWFWKNHGFFHPWTDEAPRIEFECRLEVNSTVVRMRWRNHVDRYAPYENEGPRAELVPPIVGCASPGLRW